jgi:hypothetical protein
MARIFSASASASALARMAAPRLALAFCSACSGLNNAHGFALYVLLGGNQFNFFLSIGNFYLTCGEHTFLSAHRQSSCLIGLGQSLAVLLALDSDSDGALLLSQFQSFAAFDLDGLQGLFFLNAFFFYGFIRMDASAFDRLAGDDLRAFGFAVTFNPFGCQLRPLARSGEFHFSVLL